VTRREAPEAALASAAVRRANLLRPRLAVLGLAVLLLAAGASARTHGRAAPATVATPAPARPAASHVAARPAASHVVIVVMENREYGEVIGSPQAPYVNALARSGGLAMSSFGIRHPSLPNYLALTGGSTFGIETTCTDCHVLGRSIVDQLERARIAWKAYLEDMPTPCFAGASAGGYAKRHNPFMYYDRVAGDPRRCTKLVPLTELAADLQAGALPTFAWITPNLCNDTHDCDVATGDRFLSRLVPPILRRLGPHGFLVLTWDEGTSASGCCGGVAGGHVATLVAGPGVRRGARERRAVDHYGVLRTVERALGLAPLGAAADPRHGGLARLLKAPRRVR